MASPQGDFDELLYSRQLYVIGNEAMNSLGKSNVLLYNLSGLGIEIAKNLVLMGIKNLTLQDCKVAALKDLGINIFLTQEDVNLKRNRAEACLPHLQDMNQFISLNARTESLEENIDFNSLLNYQVVILTECDLEAQIRINHFCRSQVPPIKFISADVYGVFASLFCDFGDSFLVKDCDGEEPKEILIGNISKENPVIVTTADNKKHGLQTGDVVTFYDIVGMEALNGISTIVNVLSPSTFSIDIKTDTPYGVYQRGGFCRQERKTATLDFEPLEKQLYNPRIAVMDYGKEQVPHMIHVGMLALHKFKKEKGRLPYPRDRNEAQVFYDIARGIMMEYQVNPHSVDMELFKQMSYTAQGQLFPLLAFLGGVAAQEVVKALTHKFTPVRQWVHLDAMEVTSDVSVPLVLRNDRYDSLRICAGEDVYDKLAHTNLFMVGCGAVGCEMLKNYAMLGIATGGGLVTITDDDLIEKSNLSRQFLYRNHHIQKSKSMVAALAVRQINPDMRIEAHQHRVSPATEEIYNESFFQLQNVIVNALDNIETRRYMDRCCIQSRKPMLESGTMGCKGHVQVIIPFLTEHYSSQSDPRDEEYPYCTIKSFPSQIEHTVQWARDKFESLFVEKPFLFNEFYNKHGNITEVIKKLEEGLYIQEVTVIAKMLVTRPRDWAGCISLARLKFEKYFNHRAQQLLHIFPVDTQLKDGCLFWQSPKRPPTPLLFNLNDEMSYMFITSLAHLLADVWGIPYNEKLLTSDCVTDVILHTKVPQFFPNPEKVILTDEDAAKPERAHKVQNIENMAECVHILKQMIPEISNSTIQAFPQHFEKDNSGVQMNFITSAANLRAAMYGIEPATQMKIKRIAGKIIPAIATTTSAVAGLVSLELLKLIKGVTEREKYRNCFLNLALPSFIFSEPAPPHVTDLCPSISFTIWDHWEVHGTHDMILQQFLDVLKQRTGLSPTMLVCGTKMIWIPLFPEHEKRRNETMLTLIKPAPNQLYVDLAVAFDTMMGDESVGPPVRYHFGAL